MEYKFYHGVYPIVGTLKEKQGKETVEYFVVWEYDGISKNKGFSKRAVLNSHQMVKSFDKPNDILLARYLEALCLYIGPKQFSQWLLNKIK